MRNILALADDMTGALEVGAHFAARGLRSVVSCLPLECDAAPVVVLNTETRHLQAADAAARVARLVAECGAGSDVFLYKKTDSTLRGNIRAELLALSRMFPHARIAYAPAYPRLGRTVRNGHLYLHGKAVHETEFANDALNPVWTSSIAELLGGDFAALVFDGEDDADLQHAARTILADASMRIAAGPGALAEQLAIHLDRTRTEPPLVGQVKSCLVLNGSRHPQSALQLDRLGDDAEWRVFSRDCKTGESAREHARENGRALVNLLCETDADAVFVIGGDTVFGFIEALGFPLMHPVCELVPGVPLARIALQDVQQMFPRRKRDLTLITKAGGFGAADLFAHVRERLKDHDAE